MKKIIHLIAAARPNFMKIAPLYKALSLEPELFTPVLIHTGQHYDFEMSATFLRDFSIPDPDIHLNVAGGTHAEQTGGVMIAYEKVCMKELPDLVIVAGDVNSTVACALAAAKLLIPVAHLEAGLRSGDQTMPEEINRLMTDCISTRLWTPSRDGDENLLREGIDREKIVMVGNIMLDSFEMVRPDIQSRFHRNRLEVNAGAFAVATFHRPFNVDQAENLEPLIDTLIELAAKTPIVFPVHPRTRNRLEEFGFDRKLVGRDNLHLTDPMGYIEFMSYVSNAAFVITDSGGIQEETTYLGIPCFTLRPSTERPVTIKEGTNRLAKVETLVDEVKTVLREGIKVRQKPALWDGQTAGRIVADLKGFDWGRIS